MKVRDGAHWDTHAPGRGRWGARAVSYKLPDSVYAGLARRLGASPPVEPSGPPFAHFPSCGHPADAANTYTYPDGSRHECRQCRHDAVRRFRDRKTAWWEKVLR